MMSKRQPDQERRNDTGTVDVAAVATRISWQATIVLASLVSTVSVCAGAGLTTAMIRALATILTIGIVSWGVCAILLSGQAKIESDPPYRKRGESRETHSLQERAAAPQAAEESSQA